MVAPSGLTSSEIHEPSVMSIARVRSEGSGETFVLVRILGENREGGREDGGRQEGGGE